MGQLSLILGLIFFFVASVLSSDVEPKIQGCGGYIKSPYKLEFHQIEIKLMTKQGTLVMKTDCAPSTGYYFIPVDRVGDYVLKISPPDGWTFDPPEYQIKFNKKDDQCSKEVDLNFEFKGFAIYGQVITNSFKEGPAGVDIALSGPHNIRLNTVTSSGGQFSFESIPPGMYVVKASNPNVVFERDEHKFEITSKNIKLLNEIRVRGFSVSGRIMSDNRAIEGVQIMLYGKPGITAPQNCLEVKPGSGDGKDGDKFICMQESDSSGNFRFVGVFPGSYTLKPEYRGSHTKYDVNPEQFSFEVLHQPFTLAKPFQVEGFTVHGSIDSEVDDASVFVDGEFKAEPQKDGSFVIPRMKPGKYQFQIKSEKFEFQTTDIEVTPLKPVIPKFSPSRFRVCGSVNGRTSSGTSKPFLTIRAAAKGQNEVVLKKEIVDLGDVCVFLPRGEYKVTVESDSNRFYIPQESMVKVPYKGGSAAFQFRQFFGKISGYVTCTIGCNDGITVTLYRTNGDVVHSSILQAQSTDATKFKFNFEDLESGTYTIQVSETSHCWENGGKIVVDLKAADVDNLKLNQKGYKLRFSATHDTSLKITQNNNVEHELTLEKEVEKEICLEKSGTYSAVPSGCHIFERSAYTIDSGKEKSLRLVAVKHLMSGKVLSTEKIEDLRVKINDEFYKKGQFIQGIQSQATKGFEYTIEFGEAPNVLLKIVPTSVGFSFEPLEVKMTSSDDCRMNAFEVKAKKALIIKGKFTPPLDGVNVRIDLLGEEAEPKFVTSNAKGEYIAGPFIHSAGFKVTPTKSGYTFKAKSDDEYSFTVHQLATIKVNVVTDPPGESLLNVLLSLSGPNAYRQNRYTDAQGSMSFTDLQAGQYYLKALLKEFRFEPSSIDVQLEEQETKTLTLVAKRESYSLYGRVLSLVGEVVPNVRVTAEGVGECVEHGEDMTDEQGNFRIWALKPKCTYIVKLVSEGSENKMERTIPNELEVTIDQDHIKNITFLAMTPVTRMDVSLKCITGKDKYLDSLKILIYAAHTPDVPLHRVSFNGYPFVILPQIPKDGKEYFIGFETSLSEHQYDFNVPDSIYFTANDSVAHFLVQFKVEPASVEQDIGKSSYIAMTIVFMVIILCMYFDKVTKIFKGYLENHPSFSSSAKKLKAKTK